MPHDNSTESHKLREESGENRNIRERLASTFKGLGIPLTDRQAMIALGEKDMNTIRPEITRLVQGGLLAEVGTVLCNETGRNVRACIRTDKEYFARTKGCGARIPCAHKHARRVGYDMEGMGNILVSWCPECGALKRKMTNWQYTDYPWEKPRKKKK